jgi:hypothetical protein
MTSPQKIKKGVLVECKPCHLMREVAPEKVPALCPGCKSLMYPKRNWEIKK